MKAILKLDLWGDDLKKMDRVPDEARRVATQQEKVDENGN